MNMISKCKIRNVFSGAILLAWCLCSFSFAEMAHVQYGRVGSGTAGEGGSFSIPQWDQAAMGEPLRGIRITLTVTTDGGIYELINVSDENKSAEYEFGVEMDLDDDTGTAWYDGDEAIRDYSVTVPPFPPTTLVSGGYMEREREEIRLAKPEYTGTGTIDFTWAMRTVSNEIAFEDDVFGSVDTAPDYTWHAQILLTAHPNVPEPASLAMFVIGGGVLVIRRRRKVWTFK